MTDEQMIYEALDSFSPAPACIIHGRAIGADTIAESLARERKIMRIVVYPANPSVSADYIKRNFLIVDIADQVIVFRADGKSNGTDATREYAEKRGKLGAVIDLRETAKP